MTGEGCSLRGMMEGERKKIMVGEDTGTLRTGVHLRYACDEGLRVPPSRA